VFNQRLRRHFCCSVQPRRQRSEQDIKTIAAAQSGGRCSASTQMPKVRDHDEAPRLALAAAVGLRWLPYGGKTETKGGRE